MFKFHQKVSSLIIYISSFQLYNEEIIDLLDIEQKGRKVVKVHEDNNGNIYMTGALSRPVTSGEDCMRLLEEGAISRTTASTMMNATSSRSHAIFTLQIKHHRVAPVSISFQVILSYKKGSDC